MTGRPCLPLTARPQGAVPVPASPFVFDPGFG
jgi:hypothetical protein